MVRERVLPLVVLLLPIVALTTVALFGLPRVVGLPGILAAPLIALLILGYVSLLAATLELGVRVARDGWRRIPTD